MLVNFYLPTLISANLYSATSLDLRGVLSLFLTMPLLLKTPSFLISTKISLQWFFYFYSTLSIFQCLFLSSQNNYNNNLVFVPRSMSYCTFITFNFTTLWVCSYEVYQWLLFLLSLNSIGHSGSHLLPRNILFTWLSLYATVSWFVFWLIGPFFSVSVADSFFSWNHFTLECSSPRSMVLSSLYIHLLPWSAYPASWF